MLSRRWGRVVCAVVASAAVALLVAGCSNSSSTGTSGSTGGTTGATGGGTTVVEKNFQFSPTAVTVKVGDKVTFSNQDTTAHDVVVGTTDLGIQQPGKDVSWTADKDGTVPFKCIIHPSMVGQITVGAGGGSSAPPAGGSGAPGGGSGGY